MSSLETRKIEPTTGTTVTLGAGGDTVLVSADQLKTNTVKDAGGNTLFTSDGAGAFSSVNSAIAGSMIFISSQTASSSASISFTSGIDSTYDEYVFHFVNMHPATDDVHFSFQMGSSYNTTMTTTYFITYHSEADASDLGYRAGYDQAQGTAFQSIFYAQGNENDSSTAGELHLFAPSSTTYVKQFYSRVTGVDNSDTTTKTDFVAGYFNTTSALTQIQFKMSSGNIDAGTIYLYGIS